MSKELSPRHQAASSRILTSGTRIKEMLNDLLDFTSTRLGTGIPLECAPMDLEQVSRQTVEELGAYHPERSFNFAAAGDLHGSWDSARIGQALSNLVGNAVQHGSATTEITVVVEAAVDEVTVAVHNRGSVISPQHFREIFSPMKRLEQSEVRARAAGSLGLGLYIAHEIVKGHGGRIDVESSEENGTTFTVHLPRQVPSS